MKRPDFFDFEDDITDLDVIMEDKSRVDNGAVTQIVPLDNYRAVGNKGRNRFTNKDNRDKIAQAQLKASIAGLWRDGKTYEDIAETVSDQYGVEITASGINYHIKRMLNYWRQLTLARVDEKQALLLARIEQIEEIASMAYFASITGKSVKYVQNQITKVRSKEHEKKLRKDIRRERRDLNAAKHRKDGTKGPEIIHDDGGLYDSLITVQEKINEYVRTEDCSAGDPRWLQILLDCNRQRAQIWGIFNYKNTEDADSAMLKLTDEDRHSRLTALLNAAAQRRSADLGALAPASPLNGFSIDKDTGKEKRPKDAGPVLEGAFFDDAKSEYQDDSEWE